MNTHTLSKKYCNSLTKYSRYKTRVVKAGNVGIGGDNPIRVQSMTTTNTMDTIATVEQSIRMIEAGSELVRITAPSVKDAENLQNIKNELRKRGYKTPLVADIHFVPKAAETAARIVEKVRVNPGNYADRKKFKIFSFTDEMYNEELERLHREFTPLIKICKEYGTAMRIGTNHGSLSDRIMNRYGDTPLGMVESALEFVRICEDNNYHEIILSMKASNPQVMVQAYRLLINKMESEGMNYPLHLGVTEAGEGEDGRIKSAVGIGTLLEDGIGDTIRVSLTEEPEYEIPVCIKLVNRYKDRAEHNLISDVGLPIADYNNQFSKSEITIPQSLSAPGLRQAGEIPYDPFSYTRRKTREIDRIGKHNVPVVILNPNTDEISDPEFLKNIHFDFNPDTNEWNKGDLAPDFIYLGKNKLNFEVPSNLKLIYDYESRENLDEKPDSFPRFTAEQYLQAKKKSSLINFLSISIDDINVELLNEISVDKSCVIILNTANKHGMAEQRRVFIELMNNNIDIPVIIRRRYNESDLDDVMLFSATDNGALFIDGFGDGIWIEDNTIPLSIINSISFRILQASRMRITRTEFISCPSCGRTQFDLQETTAMIRAKTSHLKGIKIAVMGCIVNGPGEMADADYGFVGSGPGWISLYRGKEVIKRGIPYADALDKLIEIMKEDGVWIEQQEQVPVID